MVTQQLIFGLRNHHHQSQVLSEAAVLTTLKAKIEKLQCLEATVASTDQMRVLPAPTWNGNTSAAFTRSSYKREKGGSHPPPQKTSNNPCHRCKGCGRTSHEGKTLSRKDCPAFNKVCTNCGIKGHFRAVCQKQSTTQPSRSNAVNDPQNTFEQNHPSDTEDPSFSFATTDFRLAPTNHDRT